jgi:outer membrane protein TolC
VRNEVTTAYVRLERAQAAEAVYRDNVREAAARNLDVLRQAYTLGQKTALDYIAEQQRFIGVETGYTDLLKARLEALIEIDSATGLPPVSTERKIKTEN